MALTLTRRIDELIIIEHRNPEVAAALGPIVIRLDSINGRPSNGRARISVEAAECFSIKRAAAGSAAMRNDREPAER